MVGYITLAPRLKRKGCLWMKPGKVGGHSKVPQSMSIKIGAGGIKSSCSVLEKRVETELNPCSTAEIWVNIETALWCAC